MRNQAKMKHDTYRKRTMLGHAFEWNQIENMKKKPPNHHTNQATNTIFTMREIQNSHIQQIQFDISWLMQKRCLT